jgi:DNA-binding NarL/FixJ family response regulator
MMPGYVLVVDDHWVVINSTVQLVKTLRPESAVRTAASIAEAEGIIGEHGAPEYVMLDLFLPDSDGLAGLVRLRGLAPKAVIAVLSAETGADVMRDCFAQGARGYITKSRGAEEFSDAMKRFFDNGFFFPPEAAEPIIHKNPQRLTERELEVLRALESGKVNKQLADTLGITESTYKTYLRSIYKKLDVRTRVEAVRRGTQLGLIDARRRA